MEWRKEENLSLECILSYERYDMERNTGLDMGNYLAKTQFVYGVHNADEFKECIWYGAGLYMLSQDKIDLNCLNREIFVCTFGYYCCQIAGQEEFKDLRRSAAPKVKHRGELFRLELIESMPVEKVNELFAECDPEYDFKEEYRQLDDDLHTFYSYFSCGAPSTLSEDVQLAIVHKMSDEKGLRMWAKKSQFPSVRKVARSRSSFLAIPWLEPGDGCCRI